MSDTTSKDDELWAELEDALVQSFEYGKGDTSKNPPILGMRRLKYLIKQYGLQERIDALDMVSCRYGIFRDTTLGKPVSTKAVSLKDIEKYKAELTALKYKQETK